MGVKRGTYQTKKQLLQNQCADRGIKFAVRWGTRELQAALDGQRSFQSKSAKSEEKKALQRKLIAAGIPFSGAWNLEQLKAALSGELKPYRETAAKVCLPASCTCGRPVDMAQLEEIRCDLRMHQKTDTHHFDGLTFNYYKCECGQSLVVKVPIKSRAVKCECGWPAVLWDKDGAGKCAHCAVS